jgi:hypothetical protein
MGIITDEHMIVRNQEKYIANKLGDEIVMMNLENGNFVTMNNVGTDIWNLTERPLTIKDIVSQLMKAYEISEDQCRAETLKFLQQSTEQNIFIISNPQDR